MRKKFEKMSDEELERIVSGGKRNFNKMSDEELENIISSSEHEKPTPQGFKGIGHDIYETFAEPLRHPLTSALGAAQGLASEAYGLGKQAIQFPFEAAQAVMAPIEELPNKIPRLTKNIAQGFENFVNTPANIAGYLGKHGIAFPEDIAERAHIKINPFEMGERQSGDIVAQGLPSFAALGPLGEMGELGQLGRAGARAATGAGIGITQNQNPLVAALMNSSIPAAISKMPGITNKSISKLLSNDKSLAIKEANQDYTNWFNKAKDLGANEINRPHIMAGDIVKHSVPKHHEALVKFLDNPTLENAHWAQSDLGFLKRHLESVARKQDLTSTQHNTLKNVIEAQNRIKQSMFDEKNIKNNPELEKEYNHLSQKYAENVVPLKEIQELSEFENKELTANNLVKKLLNNDKFMLGIGKKYPQLHINKALRSKPAKILGGAALGGIGAGTGGVLSYEIAKQLLK